MRIDSYFVCVSCVCALTCDRFAGAEKDPLLYKGTHRSRGSTE